MERVGDSAYTLPMLWGLFVHLLVQAKHERAHIECQRSLEQAERRGDPSQQVVATASSRQAAITWASSPSPRCTWSVPSRSTIRLRALVSLSKGQEQHGSATEARGALRELVNGFTEGTDTPAMRQARALLVELDTR